MSEQQADEATSATSTSETSDRDGSPEPGTSDRDAAPARPGEIADEQLPEDLQPDEDNPLARHPDQTGDEGDRIGADREEAPQTAPLRAEDADYGSGGGGSGDSGGSDSGAEDSGGGDAPQDGRVDAAEDDGSESLEHGGGGAG